MTDFFPSQVWRHCPYCGAQQIEWEDGTHHMGCAMCKKSFYINASAAVVALIENQQGELLLTRRKNDPAKGTLDLPGGFVNIGETAENAVRREIKEELNLEVNNIQYFESFPNRYLYGGIVYFTLDMVFRCHVNDFACLSAADDVSDYEFISPKDICLDDIGLESIRAIIRRINT